MAFYESILDGFWDINPPSVKAEQKINFMFYLIILCSQVK